MEAARRFFKMQNHGFSVIGDDSSLVSEAKAASRRYLLLLSVEHRNWSRVVASGSGKSDDSSLSLDLRARCFSWWRVLSFEFLFFLEHFCDSLSFFNLLDPILLLPIVPCNSISHNSCANMLNNHRN